MSSTLSYARNLLFLKSPHLLSKQVTDFIQEVGNSNSSTEADINFLVKQAIAHKKEGASRFFSCVNYAADFGTCTNPDGLRKVLAKYHSLDEEDYTKYY